MSKVMKTRIQLKADSVEAWNRASDNDFKVLDREAIFYTDADAAKYPIPMKVNLTGEDKAPSELDFIAECATPVDIQKYFGATRTIVLEGAENASIRYALSADLLSNNGPYDDSFGIETSNEISVSIYINKIYIYTECYDEYLIPKTNGCTLIQEWSVSDQNSDDQIDYVCQIFELDLGESSFYRTYTFEAKPGNGGY